MAEPMVSMVVLVATFRSQVGEVEWPRKRCSVRQTAVHIAMLVLATKRSNRAELHNNDSDGLLEQRLT